MAALDKINYHRVPDTTEKEKQPVTVTLKTFSSSEFSGLVLDLAKRYDLSNPADAGTDISTLVSVDTTNGAFTLADIFLPGETKVEGLYQAEVVIRNSGSSRKEETNLVYPIV